MALAEPIQNQKSPSILNGGNSMRYDTISIAGGNQQFLDADIIEFPKELFGQEQKKLGNYDKIEKIGEGTFGQVYKGEYVNPDTGEKKLVALKKLNMINEKDGFPITALREIKYLKQLSHENVVKLEDIIASRPRRRNKQRGSFYLVFEYLKYDLQGLIDKKITFELSQLKCLMIQMLHGLIYLHQQKVMHRDIKGANILISSNGVAKIGDFGLARIYYPGNKQAQYTNRVVTLWYRAPELLLGARNYSDTLDTWSMGCVFAEMVLQHVLFPGDKEEKQVELIYDKCGSVDEENWPGVTEMKAFKEFGPKKKQPRKIKEYLMAQSKGKINESLADLIDHMLTMDPRKRYTATQALNHHFFTEEPVACKINEQANKFIFIQFSLPLPDEDYHEFIVKSEKKQKVNFKKKFAFYKQQYDINDPLTNNIWKPSMENINTKKFVNLLQPALIPAEEQQKLQELQQQQQQQLKSNEHNPVTGNFYRGGYQNRGYQNRYSHGEDYHNRYNNNNFYHNNKYQDFPKKDYRFHQVTTLNQGIVKDPQERFKDLKIPEEEQSEIKVQLEDLQVTEKKEESQYYNRHYRPEYDIRNKRGGIEGASFNESERGRFTTRGYGRGYHNYKDRDRQFQNDRYRNYRDKDQKVESRESNNDARVLSGSRDRKDFDAKQRDSQHPYFQQKRDRNFDRDRISYRIDKKQSRSRSRSYEKRGKKSFSRSSSSSHYSSKSRVSQEKPHTRKLSSNFSKSEKSAEKQEKSQEKQQEQLPNIRIDNKIENLRKVEVPSAKFDDKQQLDSKASASKDQRQNIVQYRTDDKSNIEHKRSGFHEYMERNSQQAREEKERQSIKAPIAYSERRDFDVDRQNPSKIRDSRQTFQEPPAVATEKTYQIPKASLKDLDLSVNSYDTNQGQREKLQDQRLNRNETDLKFRKNSREYDSNRDKSRSIDKSRQDPYQKVEIREEKRELETISNSQEQRTAPRQTFQSYQRNQGYIQDERRRDFEKDDRQSREERRPGERRDFKQAPDYYKDQRLQQTQDIKEKPRETIQDNDYNQRSSYFRQDNDRRPYGSTQKSDFSKNQRFNQQSYPRQPREVSTKGKIIWI
eukprot:403332004